MLKRLAQLVVLELTGQGTQPEPVSPPQATPQPPSAPQSNQPVSDSEGIASLERLIWRSFRRLPANRQAALLMDLLESTQAAQSGEDWTAVNRPAVPRVRPRYNQGAAIPFSEDRLREEMIVLRNAFTTSAQTEPSFFSVLPKGSAKQTSTWRVALFFGGEPPTTIGLELRDDIRMGRSPSADFDLRPFAQGEHGVSRHHALLGVRPTRLTLTDLDSSNGTIVNSAYLVPNQPFEVSHGDIIALGELMFVLSIVERPAMQ